MSYTPSDGELRDHVRTQVAIGYYDADEIVEEAASMFEVDEAEVAPLVDAAIDALDDEAARWPAITDCDRLDAAFVALDRAGVRARQHFTCCNTCGHTEMIADIRLDRQLREAQIDGYVFYHRQDAEAAVKDGTLHLRYATTHHLPGPTRALGERIVEALRAHGFAPVWDGSPATTVQLHDFCWQRGAWPEAPDEPAVTAAAVLDGWTARIVATSTSDFAAMLGSDYARALVDAGLLGPALAWARAPLTSVLAPMPRARTLATVAHALAGKDGAAELWQEAFACVPEGGSAMLVEMLLDADLGDPTLRERARERVFDMPLDVHGAAAVAWFLVRSGEHDRPLIARVRRELAAPAGWDDDAVLALEAALWLLYSRLGDGDAAAEVRARLVARDRVEVVGSRAVQVAARALADASLLARPAPSPSLAEAQARLAELVAGQQEGLYTTWELEQARHALALLRAKTGDREAARGTLAALAGEYREALVADPDGVRAHLVEVANGAAPRAYVVDDRHRTPGGQRSLARALARWQAATSRTARQEARDAAKRMLQAAAALAHHGERERARELVDRVLAHDDTPLLDRNAAVIALLALDELDEAVACAGRSFPGCEAAAALAVRLVEAGRTSEALEWLAQARPYAYQRGRVEVLAPAVLAVADDRRAAAAVMLDAWARADAALLALIPS